VGPEGILYKYRKVNPWIPYEVHSSPHDLDGYDAPLFPVADTPIGRLGCAICYDWLFPEALRQLAAHGAEVLIRVSAYMDPWGATEPMNWWTIVNRCRALENIAYVVAGEPGCEPAPLPAVFMARREPDHRLRRTAARGRVAGSRRTHCHRADRHLLASP
jgi:predicted amidohydrolase